MSDPQDQGLTDAEREALDEATETAFTRPEHGDALHVAVERILAARADHNAAEAKRAWGAVKMWRERAEEAERRLAQHRAPQVRQELRYAAVVAAVRALIEPWALSGCIHLNTAWGQVRAALDAAPPSADLSEPSTYRSKEVPTWHGQPDTPRFATESATSARTPAPEPPHTPATTSATHTRPASSDPLPTADLDTARRDEREQFPVITGEWCHCQGDDLGHVHAIEHDTPRGCASAPHDDE